MSGGSFLLGGIVGALVVGAASVPLMWLSPRRPRREGSSHLANASELAVSADAAQNQHDILDTVLRMFPRPVLVIDHERVVVSANPAAQTLFHLTDEQIIGRSAASVIQDYDILRLMTETAAANTPREQVIKRPAMGQTWRVIVTPLSARAIEMSSSQPAPETPPATTVNLIITIEDLTELRRLETIRQDFVSHVSHELRTPLAAARLVSETLVTAVEQDPVAARGFAQRLLTEIIHLSQMVSELLELSRIESGKIQLRREPVDMAGLIEVVIERVRPLAAARTVTLRSQVGERLPLVDADPARVSEILVNLIDNGLKYTPAGGSVTLTASLASPPCEPGSPTSDATDVRFLTVHVADTGIGIGADDLPRVFERFFKVDRARTRSVEAFVAQHGDSGASDAADSHAATGTGLGLAITKHLVELHGGHIWAQSRLGRGSVFSFALPLAIDDASPARTGAGATWTS